MLDYTVYPKMEKEYLVLKAELRIIRNTVSLLKERNKPFDVFLPVISRKTAHMNELKLVLKSVNFI
jgi:hypothetical protein